MTAPAPRRHSPRERARRFITRNRPEYLTLYAFSGGGPNKTIEGASLQEATPHLVDQFRRTYPRELTDRKYGILTSRVGSTEDTCWFIFDPTDTMVGYCHVSWSDTLNARINHQVQVAEHEAYFFDTYVCRRHRRNGLHTFAIGERLRLLAQRGVTHGLTTISNGNTASLGSYRGFHPTPTRHLIYLPPLKRTIERPVR